mgnify:FL=1
MQEFCYEVSYRRWGQDQETLLNRVYSRVVIAHNEWTAAHILRSNREIGAIEIQGIKHLGRAIRGYNVATMETPQSA